MLAIQSASPEMAQWTMWDYNRVAAGEMAGWVAEEEGEVIGFLVARQIGERSGDSEFCGGARCAAARSGHRAFARRPSTGAKSLDAENALLEVRAVESRGSAVLRAA